MPRKTTLSGTPEGEKVLAHYAEGWSIDKIAARLSLPRSQVQRLIEAEAKRPGWTAPSPPDTSGLTAKEAAMTHAAYLKATLIAATKAQLPIKDLMAISGQYTTAQRLVARLDGSLEITAAQILRSTDFQRLMNAIKEAIGPNKEILLRIEAALERLLGEAPSEGK